MYLIKYISQCGLCSRRKAVELIKQGKIFVNGVVVAIPNGIVNEGDCVTYEGKEVKPEAYVYILLNKQMGYITTCSDTSERKTVMELIEGATDKRVYPVGRLDRMTTGLLLFTNDGELAQKLAHPSGNISKEYRVMLDKPLRHADYKTLKKGIRLDDGFIKVDDFRLVDSSDPRDVTVALHSGKYHIVRRLFEHVGYKVEKLERVLFAGLTTCHLPRGKWRFLSEDEIEMLKLL